MSPKEVVHTEMHKFKEGDLHSGSKKGPKVKNRKQAVAIALSEAKQAKGGVDRSSHNPGNPGFPSTPPAGKSPLPQNETTVASEQSHEDVGHPSSEGTRRGMAEHHRASAGTAHTFPAASGSAHCFCGTQKAGKLRVSGHSGAHRIGKR